MNIILTGASSFTGFWFARTLAQSGHRVTATFTRAEDQYEGLRQKRVNELKCHIDCVFNCSFGSQSFESLIETHEYDVFCHHAADVTSYRSPDFDYLSAVANNTLGARRTLLVLQRNGLSAVVITGSVFEGGEGAGESPLRAFSPYGLSKTLTWHIFHYYAATLNLAIGKFVIPNPFGPFEEPRFTAYLIKTWRQAGVASVKTPLYVRDNIHVGLLSHIYARFVERVPREPGVSRCGPSGYVENQGAFTRRFADEMRIRLDIPCEFSLEQQTDFSEPRMRVNTDVAQALFPEWNEVQAWDELAEFYSGYYEVPRR